ncbi:MAG: hypothetical protein HGA71_18675 [Azonexaceae bacterium]|nr:hypothetical protein [Azonexaceae bacterium]
MNLQNLDIRGKLLASFGLIVGLVIILSFVGFQSLSGLVSQATKISIDVYPKSVLANNLSLVLA